MGKGNESAECDVEKGYYNNALIAFFLRTLEFMGAAKEEYGTEEKIKIVVNGEEKYLERKAEDCIEEILKLLLDDYTEKGEFKIEIGKHEFRKEKKEIFSVDSDVSEDCDVIEGVKQNLDNLFVEPKTVECFEEKLEQLLCFYKMKEKEKEAIWSRESINVFLNRYYDILGFCLCENDFLNIEGVRENVLAPLLNLGISWNDDAPYVRMTSPLVLSAMHLVYDRLDEYLNMEFVAGKMQEKICQEIFLSKIHQIFRFYLIDPACDKLFLAAIPAYQKSQNHRLRIPMKKLSQCSSYQGIRELRLGEKILYELEKTMESQPLKTGYNIVLAGDVSEEPLMELIYYVDNIRRENSDYIKLQEIELQYSVYTNNDVGECGVEKETDGKSRYGFYSGYDKLFTKAFLEDVLQKGDFFFFLDNCQLYTQEVREIENQIAFMQSVSSETYSKHYCGITSHDMVLNCKFIDLYNALVVYAWKGRLGFFEKHAKENVIKYIHDYINEHDKKTAYIYISDIDAFNALRCVQEHIVRIEKYNQKKIGIIRLSQGKEQTLPVAYTPKEVAEKDSKHILVFNMWQFVKHNAINKRDYFKETFFHTKDDVFLNNIYIGINYGNWEEEVIVDWWTEDGVDKDVIEKFINHVLIASIEKKDKNMYYSYMKKAFISFMYGATKSIEDLIFLHILNRKSKYIKKIRMGEGRYGVEVAKVYYSKNCKYSYKKIYWSAIEKLDQEAPSLTDNYTALSDVRSNRDFVDSSETSNAVEEFLEKILSACRNINYQDSDLYDNCMYKLKTI